MTYNPYAEQAEQEEDVDEHVERLKAELNLSDDFERRLRRAFKALVRRDRDAAADLDEALHELFQSYVRRGEVISNQLDLLRAMGASTGADLGETMTDPADMSD